MAPEHLIEKIKNSGLWIKNRDGGFAKIWTEKNEIIIRDYSPTDDGHVIYLYRRTLSDLIIDIKNDVVRIDIKGDMIDAVNETCNAADAAADAEHAAGITDYIDVITSLAVPTVVFEGFIDDEMWKEMEVFCEQK